MRGLLFVDSQSTPVCRRAAHPYRVTSEMQQLQVEIDTAPRTELGDLARDLRAWRAATGDAATELGARVVATGVSPLPFTGSPTSEPRYAAIVERFGLTAHEQLTCG